VNQITDGLEAAKKNTSRPYSRWEKMQAIKAAAERP